MSAKQFEGSTKLNNADGVTAVPAPVRRKVTYIFHSLDANLSIPYATSIGGTVASKFAAKPLRVPGAGGRIIEFVEPGQTVGLYLNSDAHPAYRTALVYQIQATDHDITVHVREKAGRHTDSDAPVLTKAAKSAAQENEYVASLTGDIWMKVSHKYTAAEVDAVLPAGTPAGIANAIRSIYAGLPSATLSIGMTRPTASGQSASAALLRVTFIDSDNPRTNITSYNLLTDGLTRVHPGGYAALFNAADASGVSNLTITSCWRPMLGSIAHRAGLGLDVSMVGNSRMNRQELRAASPNSNDGDGVTRDEHAKFAALERAIRERKQAERELASAQKAVAAGGNAENRAAASARLSTAQAGLGAASKTASDAEDAWDAARRGGEPSAVNAYRASLLRCTCVQQIFDPWVMQPNNGANGVASANTQVSSNERLHAHHLHITVAERSIL